ncbi:hypothetical protein KP001_09040 [Geomonas subterranea]|uniref:Uncharacterized protein n=1 Tax=Geomonas subterranea TaxID=2847989 RepID=A0ABX8LKU1_9BACT|nr:hypothetical protein [Geomonas subterranea]QXE92643.1 hypothetical protein KP001_09040 [Geomonas subterranea]QXM09258.1 hypothetical protein KP002_20235 [Geomonas subterranea]
MARRRAMRESDREPSRKHVISFRVSDVELENFHDISSKGGPGISDVLREAFGKLVHRYTQTDVVQG